jgi:hypothetical protein
MGLTNVSDSPSQILGAKVFCLERYSMVLPLKALSATQR